MIIQLFHYNVHVKHSQFVFNLDLTFNHCLTAYVPFAYLYNPTHPYFNARISNDPLPQLAMEYCIGSASDLIEG